MEIKQLVENDDRRIILRDAVIGMSDGLTIPFALAAGLSAAVDSTNIILIAGFAEIAAGSIAMGFGGYFSVRSEYKDLQKQWMEKNAAEDLVSQGKINHTKAFFANLGLSDELQTQATEEIAKDKDKWVAFMSGYESHGMKPGQEKFKRSAFTIGVSYIIGGLIPLSPYFFMEDAIGALKYAAIITIPVLFLFGCYKASLAGTSVIKGALRMSLVGGIAAAAAFGVARIFIVA